MSSCRIQTSIIEKYNYRTNTVMTSQAGNKIRGLDGKGNKNSPSGETNCG